MFYSRLPPKLLVKETKKHKQLDNLTKQYRASSVEETFTISEENWIKKITPQKACEKTTTTILEENCIKKSIVDCVNKNKKTLFYILIDYLITV